MCDKWRQGRSGFVIATRALEVYWSGFTKWFLDRTDRTAWRHRDEMSRLRMWVLQVGEALIAGRQASEIGDALATLEQLEWHADLARERNTASERDLDRLDTAIATVRGMLSPSPQGIHRPEPVHPTGTNTTETPH